MSTFRVLFVLSWGIGCSSLGVRTVSMQSPGTGLSPLETLTANYLLLSVVGQPREKQALRNYKRGLYALRNSPEGLWFRGACPPIFQLVRFGYLEAAIAYLNCYNQQKRDLRHRKGVSLPAVCPLHRETLVTLALSHVHKPLYAQLVDRLIMYGLVYNVDTFSRADHGVRVALFKHILPENFWLSINKLEKTLQAICDLDTGQLPRGSLEWKRSIEVDLGVYGSLSAWRIEPVNHPLPELLVSRPLPRRLSPGSVGIAPSSRLLPAQLHKSLQSIIGDQSFCDKVLSDLCSKATELCTVYLDSRLTPSQIACVKHVAPLREILQYGCIYGGHTPENSTATKRLSRVVGSYCFSCKKGLSGKGLCKGCGRSWCRMKVCRRYRKKYEERLIQRIQKKPLHECASCGRARGRFRCTGCNSGTWYCNRLCQKRHWQVHSEVCAMTKTIKAPQCSWPGCPSNGLSNQDCDRVFSACLYEKCKKRAIAGWCWRKKCEEYGWQVLRQHGVKYHKGLDGLTALTLQGLLCSAISFSIDFTMQNATGCCGNRVTKRQLLAACSYLKDRLPVLPFTLEDFVEGLSMTYQQREEALPKLARALVLPPWDVSHSRQVVRQHGVKYRKGLDFSTAIMMQDLLCCVLSLTIDLMVEEATANGERGPTELQLLTAFNCVFLLLWVYCSPSM